MIDQTVLTSSFDVSRVCNFCTMGRGVDWAVQDVAQLRQWLEEGRKPREIRALRPGLVAGQQQDVDQAAAPRCARLVPSAEAAANE